MNGTSGTTTRFMCARCGESYLRTELEPKRYPVGGEIADVCYGCWNLLTAPLGKRP